MKNIRTLSRQEYEAELDDKIQKHTKKAKIKKAPAFFKKNRRDNKKKKKI